MAFVMQSIEHFICYGKRLLALRAGLEVFDRSPALRPDQQGLDRVAQLAAVLGSFPRRF